MFKVDTDRELMIDVQNTIFDALPTPVYFKDIEGRFITCNDAFAELNEMRREEIIGKTAYDLFEKKYADFFTMKDQELITNRSVQMYEHSFVTASGKVKSILAQKKLFFDGNGNLAGTFAIISDITVLKQTERKLKILSEKYAQIFNVTTDSLFILELSPEKEFHYIAVNKAYQMEIDLLEEEVMGRTPLFLYGDSIGSQMEEKYMRCLEGNTVIRYRERLFLRGGEWWDTTLTPLINEEGSYILGSSTNITDRVLSERLLQESEERFRKYVEYSPNSIMVMNDQGKYVFANRIALERLGYTQEELSGLSYQDLLSEESIHTGFLYFSELVESGKSHGLIKSRTKDGRIRNVLVEGVKIQEDQYLIFGTDITERMEMEAQLKDSKEAAEAANEAKGQFLANMSHEIRTPMNGIMGMTELALIAETAEEQKEYLNIIKKSSKSLLKVLNDVLDYSQVEAGKMTLEQKPYPLHELLCDVTELFEGGARQKGLYLNTEIHESVPHQVVGDPVKLRQVLSNLIGNGIKFTSTGGVDIHVEQCQDESTGTHLRFEVADTGIGIPEEFHDRLFHRFSRAEDSYTQGQGGTGLGLAISKGLVEMMGGEIGVVSEERQGSRFYFTIDASPDDA